MDTRARIPTARSGRVGPASAGTGRGRRAVPGVRGGAAGVYDRVRGPPAAVAVAGPSAAHGSSRNDSGADAASAVRHRNPRVAVEDDVTVAARDRWACVPGWAAGRQVRDRLRAAVWPAV